MISDEIKRLHDLHQAGALSDAEFEQAKARILSGASTVDLGKDASTNHSGSGAATNWTFRRSRDDRWVAGICGGLAKMTGLESWMWRLLLAIILLSTVGGVVLVYLLLWIFVPEE